MTKMSDLRLNVIIVNALKNEPNKRAYTITLTQKQAEFLRLEKGEVYAMLQITQINSPSSQDK